MPNGNVLTPLEAANIATNSYFTLKDWLKEAPVAGVESSGNIHNRVLGDASVGSGKQLEVNSSLKSTTLGNSTITNVHSATTGIALQQNSGFGYTLKYNGNGTKHVVIATRGTRPEMPGMPDLFTDLRISMDKFGSYGPVHKGFKRTYESIIPSLVRDKAIIDSADVIHCVGHSLGGAVATLIAGHYANSGKNVKLYTFGCPRVGILNSYKNFEQKIGMQNIYRVCHDLDPVTFIGPYPYMHLQPAFNDPNHMIMPSPTSNLLSTANHDMAAYIRQVEYLDWEDVKKLKKSVAFQDELLMRWLLHKEKQPSWVQYACAETLTHLFRLFRGALQKLSVSVVLGLTLVDVVAELLVKGMHIIGKLGETVLKILEYTAVWAGFVVVGRENFTVEVVRMLLEKMMSALKAVSINAIHKTTTNIKPVAIGLMGAWTLTNAGII
ncbi:lipase family protein [Kaarinaea lacus]